VFQFPFVALDISLFRIFRASLVAMTPSLIENAADLCVGIENCSSNIENGGCCLLTAESEIRRKSVVSSSQDYSENDCTTATTPRFTLRKRSVPDDQRGHVISSYNSDFLSGIFADIAKAASSEEESDPNLDVTLPSKKSRISLTKSISRCARSCANLAAVSPTPDQGRRLVTFDATKTHRASKKDLHHCVSNSSNEENSPFGNLAFPQLPSSVTTEPSAFTLTPKNQGQQPPATLETPSDSKDYGWFVEMDDECTGLSVNAYNNQSQKNLAFLAPTAPNGVDNDAEVEWAKAADTVDDVLGDFF
jgi:hypothetical protein